MFQARPILGFLCRFAMVFALLAAPWPGWHAAYARGLRQGAKALFGRFGAKGVVMFRANPTGDKTLDTEILLGNREKLDAKGQGDAARLPFNTRFVAYFPTALVVGLVLASGVSWRRRAWALLWGLAAIHALIAFWIWLMLVSLAHAHPELGLPAMGTFGQRVVGALYEVFLTYLGARFAAAVLVWILVTFRRGDWALMLASEEQGTEAESADSKSRRR